MTSAEVAKRTTYIHVFFFQSATSAGAAADELNELFPLAPSDDDDRIRLWDFKIADGRPISSWALYATEALDDDAGEICFAELVVLAEVAKRHGGEYEGRRVRD